MACCHTAFDSIAGSTRLHSEGEVAVTSSEWVEVIALAAAVAVVAKAEEQLLADGPVT